MRRCHFVIVGLLVSVLAIVILPAIPDAQAGLKVIDQRDQQDMTEEELARVLRPVKHFERDPDQRKQLERDPDQASGFAVALKVFFETDSATILPAYLPELDKLGRVLVRPEYAAQRLLIAGYTDNVGSDHYNLLLSERRAASIKDYLERHFSIAPARLIAKGYGKQHPLAKNSTPAGREKNRRIEVASLGH